MKQRGRENKGPPGIDSCPKILLLKRAKMVLCPFRRSHREICTLNRQFLRRGFWMISGGPFLSRPLWLTADYRGLEERSPCLQRVECKFVILAVFVKTAPFWQGTKTRFTKNTVCATPNNPERSRKIKGCLCRSFAQGFVQEKFGSSHYHQLQNFSKTHIHKFPGLTRGQGYFRC